MKPEYSRLHPGIWSGHSGMQPSRGTMRAPAEAARGLAAAGTRAHPVMLAAMRARPAPRHWGALELVSLPARQAAGRAGAVLLVELSGWRALGAAGRQTGQSQNPRSKLVT